MTGKRRVALVGDYNPAVIAHQAIPAALRLAGLQTGDDVEGVWLHTSSIVDPAGQLRDFAGIWCVPASPYANADGAVEAIRYAREQARPFLGTCAGFQHALLEYARNVCGLREAAHAEDNPEAACRVISPLSCSLVEKSGDILLKEGSQLYRAYGKARITEGYHCNYGLNPEYEPLLFGGSLRPTAHDLSDEVRAVELSEHPFFVATLFQPERAALRGKVPPLVAPFVAALQ
jgi:CTP synthase (UTP-ammonia lyase)